MMYPILCKVKYETLHKVFAHREIWVQLGFSVFLNWIVAPLIMVSQSSKTQSSSNKEADWIIAWSRLGISARSTRSPQRIDIRGYRPLYRNGMSTDTVS